MADNFNIRDSDQDPSYHFYSAYSNVLAEIVNSFELTLSSVIQ